jgi:hypothetical protein
MIDIPDFRPLRIAQSVDKPGRKQLDTLDHLIVAVPERAGTSAFQGLPRAAALARLLQSTEKSGRDLVTTHLDNKRGTAITLATVKPGKQFELLTRARKLIAESGRINAGRRMPLEEHQVAAVVFGRRAPEMVEADLIQAGRRRITRNVSAILGTLAVGLHDHGHGVPADTGLDSPLQRPIARILGLLTDRYRIQVSRVRAVRQIGAGSPCLIDHALQQVVGPLGTMDPEDGIY